LNNYTQEGNGTLSSTKDTMTLNKNITRATEITTAEVSEK